MGGAVCVMPVVCVGGGGQLAGLLQGEAGAVVADHPPAGDAEDESARGEQGTGHGVRERGQGGRIGQQRDDVGELGAAGVRVVLRADRVLHEGVRHDDEVGGQVHRHRDDPDGRGVQPVGDLPRPEDPQAEEGGLEEEGDEPLEGQGAAEDVADHAGIVRPVHAELELLDDAGCHTHGEVDEQDRAEEPGGPVPGGFLRDVPERLHGGDHGGQADGQWDEDEVIDGGDTELPP